MTIPQSPVVAITAETVPSNIPFPCWLRSTNGHWKYFKKWPSEITPFSLGWRFYCQNPPDRMPGAVEDSAHSLPASCLNAGSSSATPTASGDHLKDGEESLLIPEGTLVHINGYPFRTLHSVRMAGNRENYKHIIE